MIEMIQAVTVYCSSSKRVASHYLDAARELGEGIARAGWILIYGGNCVGCMGVLADGARGAGGKVVGITPQLLKDRGIADEKCDELIVTEGVRERKALLEKRGDAFVALPGGIGTMEEVFEILVGKSLGYHTKPIVLVNVEGYWTPMMEMLEHGVRGGFIREGATELIFLASNAGEAIEYLKRQ
jgi:cytokinin riboside 5'-monophosphate phosphoribohydrolase